MKPIQHHKLAHLTDEHLEALIGRYYAGSKTSDLVAEFGIDARPSELFKLFSPRVVATATCPYCDVNLWQKLPNKTSRIRLRPIALGANTRTPKARASSVTAPTVAGTRSCTDRQWRS